MLGEGCVGCLKWGYYFCDTYIRKYLKGSFMYYFTNMLCCKVVCFCRYFIFWKDNMNYCYEFIIKNKVTYFLFVDLYGNILQKQPKEKECNFLNHSQMSFRKVRVQ